MLSKMAEDITESRDYTKRINTSYKHSYDETARLANVFNKMIFSIQENFDKEKQVQSERIARAQNTTLGDNGRK